MSKEFRYFYIDKKSRLRVEIPAAQLQIQRESGEMFRLYANSDSEVLVRCDGELVINPKSSNQIAIDER